MAYTYCGTMADRRGDAETRRLRIRVRYSREGWVAYPLEASSRFRGVHRVSIRRAAQNGAARFLGIEPKEFEIISQREAGDVFPSYTKPGIVTAIYKFGPETQIRKSRPVQKTGNRT